MSFTGRMQNNIGESEREKIGRSRVMGEMLVQELEK
jgi:hypothetical protein